MTKAISTLAIMVVAAIAFSFTGAESVSATRAVTHKGNGCFVRVGTGANDYLEDVGCTATDVLKIDDDGNFEFYVYQDHGQLPEGGWRPAQAYRNTFEQCIQFSFGVVCGTVKESITPSGEYKSSFKSN